MTEERNRDVDALLDFLRDERVRAIARELIDVLGSGPATDTDASDDDEKSQFEARIEDLKETLATRTQMYNVQFDRAHKFAVDNRSLRRRVEQLERDLCDTLEERDQLRTGYAQLRRNHEALQRNFVVARTARDSLQSEVDELRIWKRDVEQNELPKLKKLFERPSPFTDHNQRPEARTRYHQGMQIVERVEEPKDAAAASTTDRSSGTDAAVGHGSGDDSHTGPLLAQLPADWPRQLEWELGRDDAEAGRTDLLNRLLDLIDDWVVDAELHRSDT